MQTTTHPKALPDGRLFKIHCSQIGKIQGRIGLTETQEKDFVYLRDKPTKRTDIQEKTFSGYLETLGAPKHLSLPQTAKTFLHEWYANDREQLFTKEINKGNVVEADNIEFMCQVLGLGVAEKNLETKEDDHFIGTCDVDTSVLNAVIDVKSSWNRTTFHSNVHGMNGDYKWQGIGYCHLWKRQRFILFYGLLDTPADVNYEQEIVFEDRPENERWLAYQTPARPDLIPAIIERVELCRDYLIEYDKTIRARVGRITEITD